MMLNYTEPQLSEEDEEPEDGLDEIQDESFMI